MFRPCPICYHKKYKVLYSQRFTDHISHDVSSCKSCGFVFVSNLPSQNYYGEYYRESSKYEGVKAHEPHEKLTKKVLSKFLFKNSKKNARILDIGCSTGSLLSYIRRKGYNNLFGFDPSPMCKVIAYKRYRLKIETADILKFKSNKKYDFIILSQVLEHLRDLRENMTKVKSLLSNNGFIFIGVPNINNFKLKFSEPFMEFSTEHINFFSMKYLYKLMENYTCVFLEQDHLVTISIWKKEVNLKFAIDKYIQSSKRKMVEIKQIINKLPTKIIAWGAGALTQRLLTTTNLKQKVIKYVDSNKNIIGKKLGGVEIISPRELYKYSEPVLILSYRYKDEIKKLIRKKKFKNKIITLN